MRVSLLNDDYFMLLSSFECYNNLIVNTIIILFQSLSNRYNTNSIFQIKTKQKRQSMSNKYFCVFQIMIIYEIYNYCSLFQKYKNAISIAIERTDHVEIIAYEDLSINYNDT